MKDNTTKKVSIVIPNYNGLDLLQKNLNSVVGARENPVNRIVEIIVVDDFSTDLSVKFLKKFYPGIKIIKHKKNRGFSAAVNTGARTSKGELVVLLNNDVIVSSNFLQHVVEHFDDDSVFAVSLAEKGYSWSKAKFEKGFVEHSQGTRSKKPKETFWVNGGSGVFRRSYWMKLGGMDEKLFSPYYWEDIDICYRAMKRGWRLLWEHQAKVIHEHEATTGKINKKFRMRIQERNQLLFIWKNITSANLTKKHIKGLIKRISRHPGYLRIVVMAITKLPVVVKLRNKERKECKVSDETIFARF